MLGSHYESKIKKTEKQNKANIAQSIVWCTTSKCKKNKVPYLYYNQEIHSASLCNSDRLPWEAPLGVCGKSGDRILYSVRVRQMCKGGVQTTAPWIVQKTAGPFDRCT